MSKISRNFAVTLAGVALGGVVYYFVYQLVIWIGLDTELLKMFSALIVAVFLAVPYWKKRWFTGKKFGKKSAVTAVAVEGNIAADGETTITGEETTSEEAAENVRNEAAVSPADEKKED